MFLSCLSPCWCGSVWVAVLADGVPLCRVSAVGSFTLFTVGCGFTVNLVLCLLCGWVFPCVVCGIAGHLLYCWSGFYCVEFLHYRGRTVLYALCVLLLVLSVWWCIVRCCMCATACLLRPCWEKFLGSPKMGWVVVILSVGRVLLGLGGRIIFMAFGVSAGHQRFCWGLCWNRHLSGCCRDLYTTRARACI